MRYFLSNRTRIVLGGVFWLIVLGCRTTDFVALAQPTATATVTRTASRPTFTRVPPTLPPTVAPPTNPPPAIEPTRAPTTRRPPTRAPTPAPSPTPAPPPPTPDPYAGFYFKPTKNVCVTADNTRIQGTVYNNGVPANGITVRVSAVPNGPPAINDFITGVDPSDHMHQDPSLRGQYRLGLYEGQRKAGNWFVFLLFEDEIVSPSVLVSTTEGPGCNTATVDFAH